MTRPVPTKLQRPTRPNAETAESAQPLSRSHETVPTAVSAGRGASEGARANPRRADSSRMLSLSAPPLLTEREVATLLAVSVKTLRNWRLNGQGPPFRKLSRLVRYAAEDLETWTDARRRNSTSDRGGDVDA
jgi:predicted DNA-binding transcriptional regulator AlpA